MPARNIRFRALTNDFRQLMDRRGCWPKYAVILQELKDQGGGRKEDYSRLKAGGTVPEKYLLALAGYLKGKPVMAEFYALRAVVPSEILDSEDILDLIAGPVQAKPASPNGDTDQHMKGIEALVGLFTDLFWGKLTQPETLCKDEAEVGTAISLAMASIGRGALGQADLPAAEAIRAAERHMGISQEDYLRRAISLWRESRWSIAFASINRQRVGCSIVLPLSETAYEALRSGERHSHSLRADDLTVPSQTFFLEVIAHRPDAEIPAVRRKTGQVVRMIYVQLAALSLSRSGQIDDVDGLRVLSIAGNPTNAKRLKNSGFLPTGTNLPGSNVALMEMDQREAWLTPAIIRRLQKRLLATGIKF